MNSFILMCENCGTESEKLNYGQSKLLLCLSCEAAEKIRTRLTENESEWNEAYESINEIVNQENGD